MADIHGMTTLMAAEASKLDAAVKELRGQAADLLAEAKKLADQHVQAEIARAQAHAETLLTNAKRQADELTAQADEADATAARWRHIAFTELTNAGLPPLVDGSTPEWIGPDGRTWPLGDARYRDGSGAVWHWASGFEAVDGVEWPLMSRDDFAVKDVPLLKCPGLTLLVEADVDAVQPAPAEAGGRS